MVFFAIVVSAIIVLLALEPSLGHVHLLLNILLCSLLGSITVLASAAISHFISRLKTHPEVLLSPVRQSINQSIKDPHRATHGQGEATSQHCHRGQQALRLVS